MGEVVEVSLLVMGWKSTLHTNYPRVLKAAVGREHHVPFERKGRCDNAFDIEMRVTPAEIASGNTEQLSGHVRDIKGRKKKEGRQAGRVACARSAMRRNGPLNGRRTSFEKNRGDGYAHETSRFASLCHHHRPALLKRIAHCSAPLVEIVIP